MKKFVIFILILALFLSAGFVGFKLLSRSKTVREKVVQTVVTQITNTTTPAQTSLVHKVLGFEEPRTYLLLLLNNTELRPGGGFIGSYGVIRFINGAPELLKVEGTEILDHSVPQDIFETPPEPLKKYLQIDKWQFRDSNWSPDFASGTEQILKLYRMEKGVAADEIDGVIGITPTVVERVLEISGPITVNGVTFDAKNFTRTLEHEVEYGYADKGLEFSDRKQMLKDVTRAMLAKMSTDVFLNWSAYTALLPELLNEKQIVAFSFNQEEQDFLKFRNWAGVQKATALDYLMWVDSNLGALKTDLVIDRNLDYTVSKEKSGYVATVKMTFKHNGTFDKFTTRYRDYARVYVPEGSKLLQYEGFMEIDKSTRPGIVDQGVENGKQWFGSFVSIEPKKTKTVMLKYLLPKNITEQIENGQYDLLVQKQIGTLEPRLTLNLDFDRKVIEAKPAEDEKNALDDVYSIDTTLKYDRVFSLILE